MMLVTLKSIQKLEMNAFQTWIHGLVKVKNYYWNHLVVLNAHMDTFFIMVCVILMIIIESAVVN